MRRRKPRVVWLPNTNANSVAPANRSTVQTFIVGAAGSIGDIAVGEIPVVIDSNQDPIGAADVSLADIFDSGYRLRRIVGKIFCSYDVVANDGPAAVLVTAGLIVRRADDTGTSLALQTANALDLDPGDIGNQSDPWIWRRAWLLHNRQATNAPVSDSFYLDAPSNNWGLNGASAVDGPHVDVKTARIISQEERLFLDVSVLNLISGGDPQVINSLKVHADLRCLATLRTSVGNRRNASR